MAAISVLLAVGTPRLRASRASIRPTILAKELAQRACAAMVTLGVAKGAVSFMKAVAFVPAPARTKRRQALRYAIPVSTGAHDEQAWVESSSY